MPRGTNGFIVASAFFPQNRKMQSTQESTASPATTVATPFVCGPLLRFNTVELPENVWTGSVMIVLKGEQSAPTLRFKDSWKDENVSVEPLLLFEYKGNRFIRYDLRVEQHADKDLQVDYELDVTEGTSVRRTFHVPAVSTPWRYMFFSCNGFCNDVDRKAYNDVQPLWGDVLRHHGERSYHAMIGGGDQVYSDDVFFAPSVKKWLDMDGHDRKHAAWTEELEKDVGEYYFNNYAQNFSAEVIRDALACIPNVFILDDHDIFDGFGSYPDGLQNCAVFQNIGRLAFLFYLLFQHQTTPERARKDGLWGSGDHGGYSFLKRFGSDSLVLGLDTRRERSLEQVLSPETWKICQERLRTELESRKSEVKHLVAIMAIPIVYPRLTRMDSLTEGMRKFQKGVGKVVKKACRKVGIKKNLGRSLMVSLRSKINIFKKVAGHFGPELLDDVIDHWTHKYHVDERKEVVEFLQQLAVDYGVRVTFVSGDVHCCSAGMFYSTQHPVDVDSVADLPEKTKSDPLAMYQVTSSAISNAPPPAMVISSLHKSSVKYHLNDKTSEEMISLFKTDDKSNSKTSGKFVGSRNWCDFIPSPDGSLTMNMRVEVGKGTGNSESYALVIPALVK